MSILVEKTSERAAVNRYEVLFHRHPGIPLLTGGNWPYSMNSVFNAGVTLLLDGTALLLAAWKTAEDFLTCARHALRTALMDGKSIVNRL